MDGGTKATVPFLYVQLHFLILHGKLYIIHFIALSMHESYTGENVFIPISKFMNANCPSWKDKIISVYTDGASIMHGCHRVVVSLLDEVCLCGF